MFGKIIFFIKNYKVFQSNTLKLITWMKIKSGRNTVSLVLMQGLDHASSNRLRFKSDGINEFIDKEIKTFIHQVQTSALHILFFGFHL